MKYEYRVFQKRAFQVRLWQFYNRLYRPGVYCHSTISSNQPNFISHSISAVGELACDNRNCFLQVLC